MWTNTCGKVDLNSIKGVFTETIGESSCENPWTLNKQYTNFFQDPKDNFSNIVMCAFTRPMTITGATPGLVVGKKLDFRTGFKVYTS